MRFSPEGVFFGNNGTFVQLVLDRVNGGGTMSQALFKISFRTLDPLSKPVAISANWIMSRYLRPQFRCLLLFHSSPVASVCWVCWGGDGRGRLKQPPDQNT
jgi:hypothetical protein